MPTAKLEHLNLHYEHQDNGGCPIIFLHGNFGSWHYWQPFLQDLPAGFTGYAPDFRGCGDSDVTDSGYDIQTLSNDILQFVDSLALNQFHLVGHSLGGAVAQELAGTIPDRTLSLTLVAPVPAEGLKKLKGKTTDNPLIAPATIFQFLDKIGIKRTLLTATFKKTMPGLKNNPAALNTIVNDAIKMDIKAFSGFLETLKLWSGIAHMERFSFPVLIIYGELDSVVPLQPLKDMQSALKNCYLHIFRQIGHSPQLESPQKFNALLSKFLQGNDVQAAMPADDHKPKHGLLNRIKSVFKKIIQGLIVTSVHSNKTNLLLY